MRIRLQHIIAPIITVAMLLTAPSAEAQFLEKLSKGLEKVNKGLEKVEEGIDEVSKGNIPTGLFKRRSKETNQTSRETATEEVVAKEDTVEPRYNHPMLTDETMYLSVKSIYNDPVSDVHEGIFAIREDCLFSFWKLSGEMLFDRGWEYAQNETGVTTGFPEFGSGVVAARRSTPNSTGRKVICLLYDDGTLKELPPSWVAVSKFEDGVAVVTEEMYYKTYYFYINTKAEKIYSDLDVYGGDNWAIRPLREGLRAYCEGAGRWGYIDASGEVVHKAVYAGAGDFNEGYAWVLAKEEGNMFSSTGELCLINTSGEIVVRTGVTTTNAIFRAGCAEDIVSQVHDGIYSVINREGVHYYNVEGVHLASFDNGSPFYAGYAFVEYDDDTWVVDTDFERVCKFEDLATYDLHWSPRFSPMGVACSDLKGDVNSAVLNPTGGILIASTWSDYGNNRMQDFKQYTASGVARINDIRIDGESYKGIMDLNGKVLWLFGEGERKDDRRKGDDEPEPEPIWETFYDVTVKVTPEEGGRAVSPRTKYAHGAKASYGVVLNDGWGISNISVTPNYIAPPRPGEEFEVLTYVDITVELSKKEVVDEPHISGCLEGKRTFTGEQALLGTVVVYAEMSKTPSIKTPYGDNTYGYIATLFDTRHRYACDEFSTYVFSTPMRIMGYQHDEASGRRWLVADGGSVTFGKLTLSPEALGGMEALYVNMVMAANDYSSPTTSPRRYRIEMLDYNSETGEFTCGRLEAFSIEHGWLDSDDERLVKSKKGFMMTKHDDSLPGDWFEGVRMKLAPKRNDVEWYPPKEWYDGDESVLQQVVDSMKQMYRDYKTECEDLF